VTVTKEQIKKGLADLGIEAGDSVVLHSSLSSMGWVEGGPDAVIDGFLEVLGADGTMMVPTYPPADDLPEVFDPRTTPSGVGRVPHVFRRRPDAIRSLDPWHPVAAIGANARYFLENHINATTMGLDSPLDRLATHGGKVVLLGVGHNRNSMIHLGELRAPAPYLHVPYNEAYATPRKVRLPDGRIVRKYPDEMPGCSQNFGVAEPVFQQKEILLYTRIGEATVQAVNAMDLIETVVEMVHADPGILLCDRPDCCFCPNARKTLPTG